MILSDTNSLITSTWSVQQENALRFFLLYFTVQLLPFDWTLFQELSTSPWSDLSFYHLLRISAYMPQFGNLYGFYNWLISLSVAITGTIIWNLRDDKNINYDLLYYWLRVALRYRLAFAIIAYGFIKVFPLQMPYPSLSNLHTAYGEFFPWKIYWHTIGITHGYEAFLGLGEIAAGVLLLYRRTVTFAAGFIIGFIGNVVVVNFAYDAGEQVYSSYLLLMALFLFAYDAPRLYRLLLKQLPAFANKFQPKYHVLWLRNLRSALQIVFIFFIVGLGFTAYWQFKHDPYKIPQESGLPGTYGFYNVSTFIFNKDTIPYSTTDSLRWQNVVFEKWPTMSIKVARPVKLDLTNGDRYHLSGRERNYESAGVGGRHYYAYAPDTAKHQLLLQNKNKNHSGEKIVLSYSRPSGNTIIVKGYNEKNDSLYAVLERIDKKYLLHVGRRKPIKM